MLTAIGVLLVLGAVPGSPPARAAGEQFGGYEATAIGMGLTAQPVIPGLLPFDTPFEGTMSLALATLSSGGQGFGRASSVWFGTPFAGIRPLIEVASGQRLPLPDYPLVIESREYEDPKQNTQPGITMKTNVKPERAMAYADSGGMTIPAAIDLGSVRTVSEVALDGASLVSKVETVVTGIDLAASAFHIDSVKTMSQASTDATSSVCSGSVEVSGASVSGTPVTIDDKGVHAQGNPVLDAGIAKTLSAGGVTVRALGGIGACDGPAGSQTTGGVLISVPLVAVGAIPGGGHVDFIIGATSASAAATLPIEFTPPVIDNGGPAGLSDVIPSAPGAFSGGSILPEPIGGSATPSPRASTPSLSPTAAEPVSFAHAGQPWLLLIGVLLLGFPGARTMRRYMWRIMALGTAT
jgi:hypothetical protein